MIRRRNIVRKRFAVPINEHILATRVRLIGKDGENLGIMLKEDAINLAKESDMDLISISQGDTPICKIISYGKFMYDLKKRKKEKKQQKVELKEIKFRPNIEEHDLKVKTNNIIKFLQEGHTIKASVRFRGRQLQHRDIGASLLKSVIEIVKDYGITQGHIRNEGISMVVNLIPKK